MAAVAALAVAVVGTVVSTEAQSKAARAQKEAGEIQSASQKIEDRTNLREQSRQERIRRAKILQAGETSGSSDSTREFGATTSLTTQVESNVARVSGQARTAGALSGLNQEIADAGVQQAFGQGIQNIGMSAFSAAGGFDSMFAGGGSAGSGNVVSQADFNANVMGTSPKFDFSNI